MLVLVFVLLFFLEVFISFNTVFYNYRKQLIVEASIW